MTARQQYDRVMADLESAGERWLEAKAAGKDTDPIEQEVKDRTAESRRLERKIAKEQSA